jgi:amino acid adenylation domain-containing protein
MSATSLPACAATTVPVGAGPSMDGLANGAMPLTDSQAGLLIAHRALGNKTLYNVVAEFDLDPRYGAGAVRNAVARLVTVQPALRLGLHELPEPHARLAPPTGEANLPWQALTVATGKEARARCASLAQELGRTEFVLEHPPLLRAAHLASADGDVSILLLCVHHAVFDGYSLAPLIRDLGGLLTGSMDADAVEPRRSEALRREMESQRRAALAPEVAGVAQAWATRLAGVPETVLYPRPGRASQTDFTGTRVPVPLGGELSTAVYESCRQLRISPFTWFSAVFAALVARHSNVRSVTVGTPVMARRTLGSYELCGLFVNTLPLIIGVDWSASFARFATTTVAAETDLVKRNSAVTWPSIVRRANPDRTSSRNAFLSCMIAMQDSTVVQPGGVVRAVREHGNQTAKLDLWLGVTPSPDGWLLELEHDDQLIPPVVAAGLAQSLREAVARAVADPNRPLAELFQDAATVVAAPRRTAVGGRSLAACLQDACQRHSRRVAVDVGTTGFTYAELNARASAVASALRARGAGPGSVVGLATATLPDTVTTMLATLRLGAVYLPLDLALPTRRIEHMLRTAGCQLVVSEGGVPSAAIVTTRQLLSEGAGATSPPPVAQPAPDVYVMFTSGSTGPPKGVLMGERPLLNLSDWQITAMGLGPDTRFLQYAPLGFDVSFQEIIPTLMAGGTVVSRDPADRRDLPAVVRRVEEAAVTHVYLPVAALRAFVDAATRGGHALPAMRMVCVSGEQLVVDDTISEFFRQRGLALMNLYGPTETHAVTTHTLTPYTDWPSHVPIGLPIPGVIADVIDCTGHLAPVGTAGELLLGGSCLARGYINDEPQTKTRFQPDPRRGGRQYHTGDLAMWDSSGCLVFLGRNDEQVKIRGYRVELGDVEAAARAELPVADAVAATRGEGPDRHLLLFAVAAPGAALSPDGSRSALARVLPSYMIPRAVLAVPEIPKTVNGKVDRQALLGMAERLLTAQRPLAAASRVRDDPLVAELGLLWQGLLGVEHIDPGESLLDCGAHSLTVLTAFAKIESEMGVSLPMLEFFRAPTLAGLAGQIRAAGGGRR